jgi:hypothetical protein
MILFQHSDFILFYLCAWTSNLVYLSMHVILLRFSCPSRRLHKQLKQNFLWWIPRSGDFPYIISMENISKNNSDKIVLNVGMRSDYILQISEKAQRRVEESFSQCTALIFIRVITICCSTLVYARRRKYKYRGEESPEFRIQTRAPLLNNLISSFWIFYEDRSSAASTAHVYSQMCCSSINFAPAFVSAEFVASTHASATDWFSLSSSRRS